MKRAFLLLSLLLTLSLDVFGQSQQNCNYPCPEIQKTGTTIVLDVLPPCDERYFCFNLNSFTANLCAGESFTYTLKTSSGSVIASETNTISGVCFRFDQLPSGTYQVCVTLNSTMRECEEDCYSFYLNNQCLIRG
jgi:hypothetical protein